jgi:hypothetical protein
MGSKALPEFVTHCVANSNRFLKIRREASDESISATSPHSSLAIYATHFALMRCNAHKSDAF